jgi:hypothetical protein
MLTNDATELAANSKIAVEVGSNLVDLKIEK